MMFHLRMVIPLALLCAIAAPAQQLTQDKVIALPADQWAAHHITPPKLIHGELLDYPVEAQFQRMDGLCLLNVVVDTQGNPQDIRIIHCTDFSFEGTSMDAAKQTRFQPAMGADGKPVEVSVKFVHQYHFIRYYLHLSTVLLLVDWRLASLIPDRRLGPGLPLTKSEGNQAMSMPVHYGFVPQGDGPTVPDGDGVYTQTRSVTGPRVVKFVDKGYGQMAFFLEGKSECDVQLTVDEKGRASNARVVRCASPEVEKVAVASLLKSSYKPGYVGGRVVAMRGVMHLNYGDVEGVTAAE